MESLTNYGLGVSRTDKHLLSSSKGSAHGGIWIEAGIFRKSQEKSQVSLFSSTHDVAQVTSKSGCQGEKNAHFSWTSVNDTLLCRCDLRDQVSTESFHCFSGERSSSIDVI